VKNSLQFDLQISFGSIPSTIAVSGECKNRTEDLEVRDLVGCLRKIPETSRLHIIFTNIIQTKYAIYSVKLEPASKSEKPSSSQTVQNAKKKSEAAGDKRKLVQAVVLQAGNETAFKRNEKRLSVPPKPIKPEDDNIRDIVDRDGIAVLQLRQDENASANIVELAPLLQTGGVASGPIKRVVIVLPLHDAIPGYAAHDPESRKK
jgi:hypothetical protein